MFSKQIEYFYYGVVMAAPKFIYKHDGFLKITCLLLIFGPCFFCEVFSALISESNGIQYVGIWKNSIYHYRLMVHWGIGLNLRQMGVAWFGTPSTLKVHVSVRLYSKIYVLVGI